MKTKLKEIVKRHIDNKAGADSELTDVLQDDLEFDSLDIIEVILDIEAEIGKVFPEELEKKINSRTTVEEFTDLLEKYTINENQTKVK